MPFRRKLPCTPLRSWLLTAMRHKASRTLVRGLGLLLQRLTLRQTRRTGWEIAQLLAGSQEQALGVPALQMQRASRKFPPPIVLLACTACNVNG